MPEGLQERVHRHVIALAWLVNDCDNGAGHGEKVEQLIHVDRGAVVVVGAVYLRTD